MIVEASGQKTTNFSLHINQTKEKYCGLVCLWSASSVFGQGQTSQPRTISIKAQDEYSFILNWCWTMSMIHSSIMSLNPLLTDGLLWTTERPCYVCYTIKNNSNFKWQKFTLRLHLFWVKMISGNHFHPFPHVWLQQKIQFSGNCIPVDHNLPL